MNIYAALLEDHVSANGIGNSPLFTLNASYFSVSKNSNSDKLPTDFMECISANLSKRKYEVVNGSIVFKEKPSDTVCLGNVHPCITYRESGLSLQNIYSKDQLLSFSKSKSYVLNLPVDF